MTDADEVLRLTSSLRGSTSSPWPTVRQKVMNEGVDPVVALVADWFEHDVDLDLVLIVSPERRVYQLVIHYARGSDAGVSGDKAPEVFEWKEITGEIADEPSPRLAAAFAILEHSAPA